jgi:hypothetical protein
MDVNGLVYTSSGIEELVVLATRVIRDKDRQQVGYAERFVLLLYHCLNILVT